MSRSGGSGLHNNLADFVVGLKEAQSGLGCASVCLYKIHIILKKMNHLNNTFLFMY